MKARYIANAGLIFEVGNKTIGLDCLCKDPYKIYQNTPENIRKELNPDILIFTHEHGDHFCGEYVKEVWERNARVQVYSTESVVLMLKELGIEEEQLHVVTNGDKLVVGDEETMQITFAETMHTGDEYADVQNLTLLIYVEGKRLVISGDALPCNALFETIAQWSEKVDWMLIPFPYMALCSTRRMISKYLEIGNVFILHLPDQKADVQNWREKTMTLCEKVNDALPQPVFPEHLGEWYTLS